MNENILGIDKFKEEKRMDYHHLVPAHILEGFNTFCTKSFLVRYCEEEVPFNCIVQFKLPLNDEALSDPNFPIFFDAEMLFSDLSTLSGPKRVLGVDKKDVFCGRN